MIRFRTESCQFPYVEAIMVGKDKGLTLRFFGANRPAIALYFELVEV